MGCGGRFWILCKHDVSKQCKLKNVIWSFLDNSCVRARDQSADYLALNFFFTIMSQWPKVHYTKKSICNDASSVVSRLNVIIHIKYWIVLGAGIVSKTHLSSSVVLQSSNIGYLNKDIYCCVDSEREIIRTALNRVIIAYTTFSYTINYCETIEWMGYMFQYHRFLCIYLS